MNFSKHFFKLLVICFLALGVTTKSEAGIGKLAAGVIEGATSMATKTANATVSLAAKTYSKSMAALLFVSTKAVQATCYVGRNACILSHKAVVKLFEMCSKIFMGIHRMGAALFSMGFVKAVYNNTIKAMANIVDLSMRLAKSTVHYAQVALVKLISNVVDWAVKAMDYALYVCEKIIDELLVPMMHFIVRCIKHVGRGIKRVVLLFEDTLIKIFDFAVTCIEKASDAVIDVVRKAIQHIAVSIGRFVARSANMALKAAWHSFMIATGLLPFTLHKMREVLIKEELDEIDAPDNRMRFARDAYVNKYRSNNMTPVDFAYNNKFLGALKMLIEQKGAQVPRGVERYGRNAHNYFIPWAKLDNYLAEKRAKQQELEDKIGTIDLTILEEGSDREHVGKMLKDIFAIYKDDETPMYAKQFGLIKLYEFHRRGFLSAEELKAYYRCVPYTEMMFRQERFAGVMRFAKSEQVLDMNGKGFFEVGAVCSENDEKLAELLEEFEPFYASKENLVKSYLDTRPYPHGIRGVCSKFVYYAKAGIWWVKSRLFKKTKYDAKEDFINALYALKRKQQIFNNPVYKQRYRNILNSFTVLADAKNEDLVKAKAADRLEKNQYQNEQERQELERVAERDEDIVMGPQVAAKILGFAGINGFEHGQRQRGRIFGPRYQHNNI